MKSLTSANAVILLAIGGLYTVPQQIQGFSADDVTDIGDINSAETSMGVDGKLSGGFVHVAVTQGITLQADSDSCLMFDTWFYQQQAAGELFYAQGIIRLPSVSQTYNLTKGILQGYKPMPDVRKTLQPRKFAILWESVKAAPI